MELIHYTNNGRQWLGVKQPLHFDEILGCVTLTGGIEQDMPWSVIGAIRRGELPIGQVASVMHAVIQQSPITAQALARAVGESKGYTAGYPNFQCPRDWLAEATDIVSPSFLDARSWTLGEGEVERCNWWADKPDTISLLTPPADAAAILSSLSDTKAGKLAMLIDLYRDAPEFSSRVAACLNLDWPALLDRAHADRYTPEALALADTHGFLPGVYTLGLTLTSRYRQEFSLWAASFPGVSVRFANVGVNLYNAHPLTDTAEAIITAFDEAFGY